MMLKYIQELIWGLNSALPSLENAYDILDIAEKADEPNEQHDSAEEENIQKFLTENKTGTITNSINCTFEIDNNYKFISDQIFTVGTKVSFTVFKDSGVMKVTNVKEIVDEWGLEQFQTSTNKWCIRTIIVEVIKRIGRLLHAQPGEVMIDLNQTTSEFIPIVGDFLELEIRSEIDENVINLNGQILEILKIRPVRPKVIEATVRTFNETQFTGCLNRDIYFNKESLLSGYIPKIGDKVTAEIIESNQGTYLWRAVKIVHQASANKVSANSFGNLNKFTSYEHSADGIKISDNIIWNAKKFNESFTFQLSIMNEKLDNLNLKDVTLEGCMGEIKLVNPRSGKMVIGPGETVQFTFCALAKSSGSSREVILFHFENVIIGRLITIKLEGLNIVASSRSKYVSNSEKYENMRKFIRNGSRQAVRGESLKTGPRFYGKRLNDWKIPRDLIKLYFNFENFQEQKSRLLDELEKAKPFLAEALTLQNYDEKLHTLLYLEEIHYGVAMRKYDQERACFIVDSSFLILEVPNLAESRPSIIVGDKIVATCLNTKVAYEGYVHNVMGSHIKLKFTHIFHAHYKGEDYKIHVDPSRAVFKKLHQAVHMAKTLIPELLFPNHILNKKTQVKFTYEPYEDIMNTTGIKMKIREVPKESETDLVEETSNSKDSRPTEESLTIEQPESKSSEPVNSKKTRQELLNIMKTITESSTGKEDDNNIIKPRTKLLLKKTNNHKSINKKDYKLEWYDKSLNYHQKEAVRNILLGESRPLPYIIFGPPGTGKTVTIIECILQILRMIPHSRLLIGAPSNSAANLLTTRLIQCGSLRPGDLVRLVSYKSMEDNVIPPYMIPYSAIASIAKEGTIADENRVSEKGYVTDMTMSAIGRHRITIGTCSTLGTLQYLNFKRGHFTHIIVDEAGQCTEPDIMIPLTHVDAHDGQIIMAGDPMQLGPVILADIVKQLGYEETYLDRLINRFPYVRDINGFPNTGGYDPRLVTKLLYNYRSLPELLTISNGLFYHNELRPTLSAEEGEEADFMRSIASILPKRTSGQVPSLVFHGINGINMKGEDCPSWYNPDEASQIFYYVNELYRMGVKKNDIGIISPYIKQVRQVRELLNQAGFELPKIGTMEEFQGLEFKVILLSTVRSCAELLDSDRIHALGFISNPRRFNVAMTRSQCLTIVIGNPGLLSSDRYWSLVLSYCVKNESYVGCEY